MIAEIEAIAREAGEIALRQFRNRDALAIESKGPLDLVSRADRDVERHIAGQLRALFPEDGILGEEGESKPAPSGRTWVVDPIDGTFNFVRGGPEWGVSIGLFANGWPSLGVIELPLLGQLFGGGRDTPARLNGEPLPALRGFDPQSASVSIGFVPEASLELTLGAVAFVREQRFAPRASGSCVAGMMEVARGETDLYLGLAERSWDVMAALPILETLGAACTLDWSKLTLDMPLRFAAGKPAAVDRFRSFGSTTSSPQPEPRP